MVFRGADEFGVTTAVGALSESLHGNPQKALTDEYDERFEL